MKDIWDEDSNQDEVQPGSVERFIYGSLERTGIFYLCPLGPNAKRTKHVGTLPERDQYGEHSYMEIVSAYKRDRQSKLEREDS